MKEKHEAARQRYRAAVLEFRDARVDLAALDALTNSPGFGGEPPSAVSFRHAVALPEFGGSLIDGVSEAMAKHNRR